MARRRVLFNVVAVTLAGLLRASEAAAQSLGAEFRVNTFTTYSQDSPRVAASAAGDFVVIWESDEEDGDRWGVFGQRHGSDGTPLGLEFQVNTHTVGFQAQPAVASDPAGDFVVVWFGYGCTFCNVDVFGQRYASGGIPLGGEFRVNTHTTSAQTAPAIAADAAGNFVVVWSSRSQEGAPDGDDYGIFGQRFTSAGSRLGSEFRVNTFTTAAQKYPSIAADPAGSFIVVWHSDGQDGSHDGVYGQRFSSAGSPLGLEFRINTYTTDYQDFPSVAMDSAGNFTVAWTSSFFAQQDGSGSGVYAQRYSSAGAPLGAEFRVNAGTTDSQVSAAVAFDTLGNFVVAWSSGSDYAPWNVFGRRFASDGSPAGPEFRVNTFPSDAQRYPSTPSIAADRTGRFVVAWHALAAARDGSGLGVFGQRFCQDDLVSATIGVNGPTTLCGAATGGVATVTDVGGGGVIHQWGYRTTSMGAMTLLSGQTGPTYTLRASDFPPTPGTYYLVELSTPQCGSSRISNEIAVTVTGADATSPIVTPPAPVAVVQSLCS